MKFGGGRLWIIYLQLASVAVFHRYFPKEKKNFTFESLLMNIGSSGEREMVNMSVPVH